MSTDTPTIRVFLSYSWDDDAHKQRVLELAQRLRADGLDAWLDRFTPFPAQGWARWMSEEIAQARFVIVVATEKYAQRFSGAAPQGTGLGAKWEGAIITQKLYEAESRNEKFLPGIFSEADKTHIPEPLRPYSYFRLDTDEGYTALYRLLTGQPEIVAAPLGSVRSLPPANPAPKLPPLPSREVHNHAAIHANLPLLPYGFFGREEELKKVLGALAPEARTWGALIDGPGGIGKTALAIRAAEESDSGQFQRIIFLSAKKSELTSAGEKPLINFIVPSYLEMLSELARQLDRADLTQTTPEARPAALQLALQQTHTLLIFDNLESLTPWDRDNLFDFLAHLPPCCKAIVTSRRRDDIDARVVRLGKLGQPAALSLIGKLAENRPLLQRAGEPERIALYENTGGNPLIIRWVAGQLGRGRCRTIADALGLLKEAPEGEAALEFIFGDLAETFTESETKALAALSHFTELVELKFIAELAALGMTATKTALEDLKDRALVNSNEEQTRFILTPLVAEFLRRARPEAVGQTATRLCDRVYALVVENGYREYERFPVLEAAWPQIKAALPRFLEGENARLQTVCAALKLFLDFSGRWDEWLSLSLQAEEKAVAAKDFDSAGWRAYEAGYSHYLRVQSTEVLACAARAEHHWQEAKADARERVAAITLRGNGHHLAKNYPAAIAAFQKAVGLSRGLSPQSRNLAIGLNWLAGAQQGAGKSDEAETNYREALRIAKVIGYTEGVTTYTGNLANLALARSDWAGAEALAREALDMAEELGRKELIAANCALLAKALARQGRKADVLPLAQRAVDLFTQLRSPDLARARKTLQECQS